jgi:protein ImuB
MSFLSIWINQFGAAITRQQLRAALVRWAYGLSPVFAFDDKPNWIAKSKQRELRQLFSGLHISLTGSSKLLGSNERIMDRTQQFMGEQNLSYRAAIAPTIGAAWALSRFGDTEQCIVVKKDLYEKILPLPLLALRVNPRLVDALHEVNVHTIGELVKLSRSSLYARYGGEILQRIDQLFGAVEEPIKKEEVPFSLTVERNFPSPVLEMEVILNSGNKLLLFLLRKLHGEQKLPAHLLIEIDIARLPRFSSEIKVSNPTGAARHLFSLLKTRLEKLDMGGGVVRLGLSVRRTVPIAARQLLSGTNSLAVNGGGVDKGEKLGMLFDVLSERLGVDSVRNIAFRESYIPERSFEFVAAELSGHNRAVAVGGGSTGVIDAHVCEERPSVLFALPHPVDVMSVLPDNPPFWLKWRGKTYRIKHAVGPERITPEWWGRDPHLLKTRDYFRVQLASGMWLWVYRELSSMRWFVHGVW